MECEQCGDCCKYLSLQTEGMSKDDKKFIGYHRKCYIYKDKLIILAPCMYLKRRNDKYVCAIHDDIGYPETCRMTSCLRKDVIGGLDELAFVKEIGGRGFRD